MGFFPNIFWEYKGCLKKKVVSNFITLAYVFTKKMMDVHFYCLDIIQDFTLHWAEKNEQMSNVWTLDSFDSYASDIQSNFQSGFFITHWAVKFQAEVTQFDSMPKPHENILYSNCAHSNSKSNVQTFAIFFFVVAQWAVKSWIIATPLNFHILHNKNGYISFSLRKRKPKLYNLKRQVFYATPFI